MPWRRRVIRTFYVDVPAVSPEWMIWPDLSRSQIAWVAFRNGKVVVDYEWTP